MTIFKYNEWTFHIRQNKERQKLQKKRENENPHIENILFIAPKHLNMLIPVSHDV